MGKSHLKGQADFAGHQFLHGREHDRVADLLPLAVPLHLSVQGGGLPGLSVGVVWSHGVHLQPCTQSGNSNITYCTKSMLRYSNASIFGTN